MNKYISPVTSIVSIGNEDVIMEPMALPGSGSAGSPGSGSGAPSRDGFVPASITKP